MGQVQSNVGGRITVNFEHAGKVVIEGSRVELQPVFDRSELVIETADMEFQLVIVAQTGATVLLLQWRRQAPSQPRSS